ncbi:acyl-dehydrogenase [Micractinium conductrix]|uniref:Isobutyryl-CoA dehydrogenase, mitochondrial n=1 Tax=Micractinium conductrix TaxID=554055 RepID=A0A2P6VFW5_9CHLO|nr:acyl-dehydrogenase [Micractinium conductrix]|eukprot:PSC72985.1 acyl-dehydrogenase [Micractinium conductrix]
MLASAARTAVCGWRAAAAAEGAALLHTGTLLRQGAASAAELAEAAAAAGQPSVTLACQGSRDTTDRHFDLTEEQQQFQHVAGEFAREELAPYSAEWDEKHHFPVDTLKRAAELGFGGMYVSDDVGGAGLGRLDAAIIFEELAWGCVPTAAYLSIHNMVAKAIDQYGSAHQRGIYLPAMCTMDLIASYCLTEPASGSDAAALKTTARRVNDHFVLTGTKAFISGGGVSDIYLVMARTGGPGPRGISAFLVEKGTKGLSFGKREKKMGWNAQPTTAVNFDDVKVPADMLLGQEGDGFKIAMAALDGGRINIGACSVGGAQFCLDTAREYAAARQQFGSPIASFQASQFKIADMATSIQASRLMVRHAAAALDSRSPGATLDCAMAKRFATDACFNVTNDALQLLGGYGYLREYPIERYMRDLRVHCILEGTNEVMRIVINRELDKLDPK